VIRSTVVAVAFTCSLAAGCEERTEKTPQEEELAADETVSEESPAKPGAADTKGRAEEPIKDVDITVAVQGKLGADESVPAHRVDVDTNDGIVTLTGKVSSLRAKQRAERIAENRRGVRSVVNRIEVDPIERTDGEIAEDVRQALASDPAAESYEIEAAVEDGRVALTGVVESWQEKQLAADIVAGVRGVVAVDNEVRIEYPEERSDEEIAEDVRARLDNDVRVDAELIEVEVDDGEVTLKGTVGSAAERTRAFADAWVTGVDAVDDSGLEVDWWARDEMRRKNIPDMSEEQVAEAVRDAFLYDPRAMSFKPEVNVDGGIVTLTGTVDSVAAKRAAEEDAANTAGVWRVRNYLRVRPPDEVKDAELAVRANRALGRNPYLDRHEVTVSVRDGEAFLYGSVDTAFERAEAERVTERVIGIIEVENNLSISDPAEEPLADWAREDDIEDELWWDPYVDSGNVAVHVDDGIATLSGEVEDWRAYHAAIDAAYEAGARDVKSELEVAMGPDFLAPTEQGPG
jgi:osmotically-inducible protein OsmY